MTTPTTPTDLSAVETDRWTPPAQRTPEERALAADVQRTQMRMQLVVLTSTVESAFQTGDRAMLDAAQEEAFRLIEIIRTMRKSRS